MFFQESPAFPATTFDLRRKLNDLYALMLGYSRRGSERRLRFKQVEEGRMRVWQVDDENGALGHVFEIVRVEE